MPFRAGTAVLWTIVAGAQPVANTVQYSDLTPAVQHLLQIDAGNFAGYIAGIERRTAERELEGENDHLIFYVLQSKEFTRAARLEPSVELATALFYGIKADTRDLDRLTTKTDVDCYVWLLPRIDKRLLGQIEHPELPVRYFRLYHTAIERAKMYGGQAVVTDLGEVYSPDMVAEVAERMVFLEGIKWSLAFASFLAGRTRRLRVGIAVQVLPLGNPLRI